MAAWNRVCEACWEGAFAEPGKRVFQVGYARRQTCGSILKKRGAVAKEGYMIRR